MRRFGRAAAVPVFFAALTALMSYPLSFSPAHLALDLGPDTRLFLWTLDWDVHALAENPLGLFDANIFYPNQNTLAYSEHQLGSAVLAAPCLAATGNPVLAMNLVLLFSCAAAGAGAYFLARRLGMGVCGALASGIIFALSPPRFFRMGQLHLATVEWMPFCLGFLHTYARAGRRRHLLAAAALFTLQALTGGHSGLFLALTAAGLLCYLQFFGLLRPRSRLVPDLAIAAILLTGCNLPFVLPYLQVKADVGLRRSLEESYEWSPNVSSFLAAPTHVQRALLSTIPGLRRSVLFGANAYLFPGFLSLALAGWSLRRKPHRETVPARPEASPPPRAARTVLDTLLVTCALLALAIQAAGGVTWRLDGLRVSAHSAMRPALLFLGLLGVRAALVGRAPFAFRRTLERVRARVRRAGEGRLGIAAGFYWVLVLASFWASLGPRFGLYAALYRLVPGFDFVRVPSRLTLLTVLGLAVLAGIGLEKLLEGRPSSHRRPIAALVLALMTVEFAAFPLDTRAYSITIPPVDRWLARQPGPFAVVELPVPDPRDPIRSARLHSLYMLHSTAHWKDLVNGYSGFTPPGHDALFRKLVLFPDEQSLAALENLGVRYAVFHPELYPAGRWPEIERKLEDFSGRLELEAREGGGQVYLLSRSRSTRSDRER